MEVRATVSRDRVAAVAVLQERGIGHSSERAAVNAQAELAAIPTGAVVLEAILVDKLQGHGAALRDSVNRAGKDGGVRMTVFRTLAVFEPDAGGGIIGPRAFHGIRSGDGETAIARVEILVDKGVR